MLNLYFCGRETMYRSKLNMDVRLLLLYVQSVLWISGLDQLDYQRTVKCVAMNRLGEDVVQITVGPPTAPDVPVDLRVANSSRSSLTLVWVPGFDGGSEQVFQVRYQIPGENVYHTINSTSPVSCSYCVFFIKL